MQNLNDFEKGITMENATRALLMAGGILLGIIIISLAVTMFDSTGEVSKTYSSTLSQEEITIFNSNFTKYIGKDLTIHEAHTIKNFADNNNVNVSGTLKTLKKAIEDGDNLKERKYKIEILNYTNGCIDKIKIYE